MSLSYQFGRCSIPIYWQCFYLLSSKISCLKCAPNLTNRRSTRSVSQGNTSYWSYFGWTKGSLQTPLYPKMRAWSWQSMAPLCYSTQLLAKIRWNYWFFCVYCSSTLQRNRQKFQFSVPAWWVGDYSHIKCVGRSLAQQKRGDLVTFCQFCCYFRIEFPSILLIWNCQ